MIRFTRFAMRSSLPIIKDSFETVYNLVKLRYNRTHTPWSLFKGLIA